MNKIIDIAICTLTSINLMAQKTTGGRWSRDASPDGKVNKLVVHY